MGGGGHKCGDLEGFLKRAGFKVRGFMGAWDDQLGFRGGGLMKGLQCDLKIKTGKI